MAEIKKCKKLDSTKQEIIRFIITLLILTISRRIAIYNNLDASSTWFFGALGGIFALAINIIRGGE